MANSNFKVKNGIEVGSRDIVTPDGTVTLPSGTKNLAPLESPTFTGTIDFSGATVSGITSLPSQTGNSGKFLTTDGSTASWATITKTTVGLSNVENTALSTWAGSSNITTVGTISTGIWQGTAVGASYIDSAIARLASPTFTGTPLAPTAAADTNTTQIATTAFVLGQAGSTNPVMNGTVAVGTSTRFARQDHVHPSDTSREPTISAGTTSQYWRGDKSWQTLDKTAVGLSNVENTALSTWAGSTNLTTLGTIATLTLSTADTASTASHYMVEVASDGVVRPKTLANVRTEIVTDTAIQTAAVSPTAAGSTGVRKMTISTSTATGGSDGDVWLVYV